MLDRKLSAHAIANLSPDKGGDFGGSRFPDTSLSADFFERKAKDVARDLIGKRIISEISGKRVAVEIHTVDAYPGKNDPDTSPYRGESSRSVKWGPGSLYVYSVQGHAMLTIATPPYDEGSCVLIRAVKIIDGLNVISKRGVNPKDDLIDGPGKVSKALGVTTDLNGRSLFQGIGISIKGGESTKVAVLSRGINSKAPESQLRFQER